MRRWLLRFILGRLLLISSSQSYWRQGSILQEGSLLWPKRAFIRSRPMRPLKRIRWIVFCQLSQIWTKMKKSEFKFWLSLCMKIGSKKWEKLQKISKMAKKSLDFEVGLKKFDLLQRKNKTRKNPRKRNIPFLNNNYQILIRRWMMNSSV